MDVVYEPELTDKELHYLVQEDFYIKGKSDLDTFIRRLVLLKKMEE